LTFQGALEKIYRRLTLSPLDAQRVGYASPLQQLTFLEVLAEIGDLSGRSVLDVGCGWGALYGYLGGEDFAGVYTGVELLPHLVEEARDRYPEADFRQGDFLNMNLPRYDYVIASGLFDFAAPGMVQRLRATLGRMFNRCLLGMAWNKFLQAACTRPEHYGEALEELMAACDALSPWVILRRDYDPGHASFYLYKSAAFDSSSMQVLAGRLFSRPEFRTQLEMEPEELMEKYDLTAKQLNRLLSIALRPKA